MRPMCDCKPRSAAPAQNTSRASGPEFLMPSMLICGEDKTYTASS